MTKLDQCPSCGYRPKHDVRLIVSINADLEDELTKQEVEISDLLTTKNEETIEQMIRDAWNRELESWNKDREEYEAAKRRKES